eukprot:5611842-Pyramimonas_sp.AAC.1
MGRLSAVLENVACALVILAVGLVEQRQSQLDAPLVFLVEDAAVLDALEGPAVVDHLEGGLPGAARPQGALGPEKAGRPLRC